MKFVPRVKELPGVTWMRPFGWSMVTAATQIQIPSSVRRKQLNKASTLAFGQASFPCHGGPTQASLLGGSLVEQVGTSQEHGIGQLPMAVQPELYEHHAHAEVFGQLMLAAEDAARIVKHPNEDVYVPVSCRTNIFHGADSGRKRCGPQSGTPDRLVGTVLGGGCYRDRTCGPFRVKEVLYR
jgi:hypothetical protein